MLMHEICIFDERVLLLFDLGFKFNFVDLYFLCKENPEYCELFLNRLSDDKYYNYKLLNNKHSKKYNDCKKILKLILK